MLESVDFYGMKVNVPSDPEGWLERNYGASWESPDDDMHFSYAGVEGWWQKIGRKFLVHDVPRQ
jgi:hypothetical protein